MLEKPHLYKGSIDAAIITAYWKAALGRHALCSLLT